MFKFIQYRNTHLFNSATKSYSKKVMRTEIKPIQRKIIEEIPIKLDIEKIHKLEKVILD
jgi:hypothetical protein